MNSLHSDMIIYGSAIDRPSGTTKFVFINIFSTSFFYSRFIRDGDEVRVGSLHFSAHLVPGHTRGHLIYRLRSDDTTIPDSLFTGDLLFIGGMGISDLCP